MYSSRASFFCILLKAFSFILACIRDPASNWDLFNIILMVTGVEVFIGNYLPEIHKMLPDFKNWEEKISNNGRWRKLLFVLLYLNACVYLAQLRRYGASKRIRSRPWPLRVTWRHRSRAVAYLGGGPRCDALLWPDHENFLRRLYMKRCVFCRFPARIAKLNNVWWSFFIPIQYAIKIAMWDCIWYDAVIFCVSEF